MTIVQKNPTWINQFSGTAKTLTEAYREKVLRFEAYLKGVEKIKKGELQVRRKFLANYYFEGEIINN